MSATSNANAQSMPPHVKKALDRLIGDWTCKTDVGGETFSWDFSSKWAKDGTTVIYEWSGLDIMNGEKGAGTGILGWDAGKQLVVEITLEASGAVYKATHHILENGRWTSPTNGTSVIDGKPVHTESLRLFQFMSDDEWKVTGTNRMVGGKPAPDDVSIIKRK